MVHHGNPWYTMVHGVHHGISWCDSVITHRNVVYHGVPQYTLVYHGIPWYTMVIYGIWWCIPCCIVLRQCHNTSQSCRGMPWYGIPWYIIDIPWCIPWYINVIPWYMVHGIPWYTMVNPNPIVHHGNLWYTVVYTMVYHGVP